VGLVRVNPVSERKPQLHAGLWVGVFAVSWAAIFIRWAQAPSLSISAWRLVFAAIPAAVWALWRHPQELLRLERRTALGLLISGGALALHFATWIASLERTSVASSVSLVTTQPVWVALLAWLFLREKVGVRVMSGIALSVVGGGLVAGADFAVSAGALWGDALALLGAVFAAIYFVVGRRVRATLSLPAYIGVVYAVAAGVLVIGSLLARQPLRGFSNATWLQLLLLALVPQLIGHSLLNWSLRYLSAPFVSLAILGEPVISTLLAIPLLGEWPGALQILGAVLTLSGVAVAAREEGGHPASSEPDPFTSLP